MQINHKKSIENTRIVTLSQVNRDLNSFIIIIFISMK